MNKTALALLIGNAILDALDAQGLEVTAKQDGKSEPKPEGEQPRVTPEPSKPEEGRTEPKPSEGAGDEQGKVEKNKEDEKPEKKEEPAKPDSSPESEAGSSDEPTKNGEGTGGNLPPRPKWTTRG